MQFVYPSFLWALSLLAIPVIIHLFHFRRYKKVIFSDLTFLKQLQEQNKASQKLKDWLILCCRLVFIMFLVFAFAQPFKPKGTYSNLSGHKVAGLYVDNSYSMLAQGSDGSLLDMAKKRARSIVEAYGEQDKFQLLTNNLTGAEQRILSKQEVLSRIDFISPSSSSAGIDEIMARQQYLFTGQAGYKAAYYVSDFQQSQFDFSNVTPDSLLHLNMIGVENKAAGNISVDSVYTDAPFIRSGQPVQLHIVLTNHGDRTAESVVVNVYLNDVQKSFVTIDIAAGEKVTTQARVTLTDEKINKGMVSIKDYPITYDDKLFFTLNPISKFKVLCISERNNPFIDAVFSTDSSYSLTYNRFGNINYQQLGQYALIIINEANTLNSGLTTELTKYVKQGGQVFIIPSLQPNAELNQFLTTWSLPTLTDLVTQSLKINRVNTQHSLFKNVFTQVNTQTDWPWVSKYVKLSTNSTTRGQALLTLNNDQAVLWHGKVDKGNAYLLAFPLNDTYSNFVKHGLFVPVMLNLGTGKPTAKSLFYTLGKQHWIPLPPITDVADKLVEMRSKEEQITTEVKLQGGDKVIGTDGPTKPGWYELWYKPSQKKVGEVAFNQHRNESTMRFFTDEELSKQLQHTTASHVSFDEPEVLTSQLQMQFNGQAYWRWCIIIALLAISAEMILIRLMK